MSPSPAAPSSASINACAITSPSEWPARPRGESIATPRGGNIEGDAGGFNRIGGILVQPGRRFGIGTRSMVLDQIRMRERVEQSAACRVAQPDEVPPPGLVRSELLDESGHLIDPE